MTLNQTLTPDLVKTCIDAAVGSAYLDLMMSTTSLEYGIDFDDDDADDISQEYLEEDAAKMAVVEDWCEDISALLYEVVGEIDVDLVNYSYPQDYLCYMIDRYLDTVKSSDMGKQYFYTSAKLYRFFPSNIETELTTFIIELCANYLHKELYRLSTHMV